MPQLNKIEPVLIQSNGATIPTAPQIPASDAGWTPQRLQSVVADIRGLLQEAVAVVALQKGQQIPQQQTMEPARYGEEIRTETIVNNPPPINVKKEIAGFIKALIDAGYGEMTIRQLVDAAPYTMTQLHEQLTKEG